MIGWEGDLRVSASLWEVVRRVSSRPVILLTSDLGGGGGGGGGY